MKYIIFVVLIIGGIWFYQHNNSGFRSINIQKKDLPAGFIRIVEETKGDPKVQDIQALNAEFFKAQDPEVKAFLVRLISLGFLATDANAFRRFKISIESKYPDEGYFNFLDEEFPAVCSNCKGDGGDPCAKCKGTGECPNIKCEKGRISYESFDDKIEVKDCFICRGSGMCKMCSGSGISDNSCTTCGGSGRKGSKTKAGILYKETLNKYK